MSEYVFVKFLVNGVDASGPSFDLTMNADYTVEAVFGAAPPPPDILIETYKTYPIWQSAVTGLFYVKNSAGTIIRDLLASVDEARAWIDTYAPPPPPISNLVPFGILGGVVAILLSQP